MSSGFNLWVGWVAILVGLITGAGVGLFFHDEAWLGGYATWRRRMIRLGHISFIGTGLLNIAFALTLQVRPTATSLPVAAALLALGAVSMPAVCFLAAWHKPFRHWFVVPVGCLVVGVSDLVVRGWLL
jgi:hypothetical protein